MKALLQKYNSRALLNIGLFAFILLLVVLVWQEPGKPKAVKPQVLTTLKQEAIEKIELKRLNEGNIQLEKRGATWYVTVPYQLPANDFRVQSVIALAEARSYLQYDAKSIDLPKFKLDKPEISITLNDEVTLEVGGVDPLHNRRYVRNDDTLHLVTDNFYYQLIGKVTAYISYQILSPEIKLQKLVLPKFSLEKKAGDWTLSPAQKDTSADSINEFVNEWRHAQSLEIAEFTGKPTKSDIRIYVEGQEQPLEFSLQKQDDSIFLVRHDLKLSYKLSDETAVKLQNLPEPPAPEEATDSEPVATEEKAAK